MGADAVHPTDLALQSYGLGKLDEASADSVSKHLSSCSDCQRRVAEMSSDSFLSRLRGPQGGPGMSATANFETGESAAGHGAAVSTCAAGGGHNASGTGRPSRLRDPSRVRTRRDGGRVSRPQ